MRQVIESHEHQFGSFGGGMAAWYVFVHLFPELDAGHDFIGDRIDGVVLIGPDVLRSGSLSRAETPKTSGNGKEARIWDRNQSGLGLHMVDSLFPPRRTDGKRPDVGPGTHRRHSASGVF